MFLYRSVPLYEACRRSQEPLIYHRFIGDLLTAGDSIGGFYGTRTIYDLVIVFLERLMRPLFAQVDSSSGRTQDKGGCAPHRRIRLTTGCANEHLGVALCDSFSGHHAPSRTSHSAVKKTCYAESENIAAVTL